ncbi:MAG: hypothetical protein HUU47_07740 [Bacteroidetes bacterium]|nr:hypothetical protein [Bacteroidota bacterium]
MKKLKVLSALIVCLSMFMYSCKKENLTSSNSIISAEDNATAESEFSSTFDLGDDVATNEGRLKKGGSTILPNGAIITITDSLFSDGDGKEFSIDFGPLGSTPPLGMLCGDGRYRAGKVHFTLSESYLNIGAILTININETDNYYGGNGTQMTQISGTKIITRTKENQLSIVVNNGKAKNEKGTVLWSSVRTITRTFDAGPGFLGDVFEMTGTALGSNRKNEQFKITIDEALKKKIQVGCANTFVKGKLTLKNLDTDDQISVDYDPYNNEACDRTAKATYKGKDYFFEVR